MFTIISFSTFHHRSTTHSIDSTVQVPDPVGHVTDAAQKESKCDRTLRIVEDELPELGIDGEDASDIPLWALGRSNVPAFEFRHAGSTRVVIRDGELRKLDELSVLDTNEDADAMEIDTTNSTTHHTISKEAKRYYDTEARSLVATGSFQPLPPEKVRLLYRYTFASVECVGTGLSTFRFSDVRISLSLSHARSTHNTTHRYRV